MNGELKSRANIAPDALGSLIIDVLERRAAVASRNDRRCLHRACRILQNRADPPNRVVDVQTQTDQPVGCPTLAPASAPAPTVTINVKKELGARQPKLEVPLVAAVKEEPRVPARRPPNLDNFLFNGKAMVEDGQRPRFIPLEPVCAGLGDPRNRANGYGAVQKEPNGNDSGNGGAKEMVPVKSESFANDDVDEVEIVAEVVKILKPVGQKGAASVKSENVDVNWQRANDASSSSSHSRPKSTRIKLESIASPEDNTDVVDMELATPPQNPRAPIALPRVPVARAFNPFVKMT